MLPLLPLQNWLKGRSESSYPRREEFVVETDEVAHPSANARMHPFTLRFEGRLEDEFAQEYFARTLSQVRSGLVLGIVLYTVFGILDTWVAPEQHQTLWVIRYAIVVPLMGAVLGFTYHHSFKRYREPRSDA